jgi:hypothetical protein
MSYNNRRKSNFNPHRNRHKRNRGIRREEEKKNYPLCPLCKGQIRELSSAIKYRETGEPAHFDCILKVIEKSEELASHEKVCYLGNGSFGIVRFQKDPSVFPFIIRKRIQYEDPHEIFSWRNNILKSS